MFLLINSGNLNIEDVIVINKDEFILVDKIQGVKSLIRKVLIETNEEFPVKYPTGTDFISRKDYVPEEIVFSNAYEVDVIENEETTKIKIKDKINLDKELKELIDLLLDEKTSFDWIKGKILVTIFKNNIDFLNEYLKESNYKKILDIFKLSLNESLSTVIFMDEFINLCHENKADYFKKEIKNILKKNGISRYESKEFSQDEIPF